MHALGPLEARGILFIPASVQARADKPCSTYATLRAISVIMTLWSTCSWLLSGNTSCSFTA